MHEVVIVNLFRKKIEYNTNEIENRHNYKIVCEDIERISILKYLQDEI